MAKKWSFRFLIFHHLNPLVTGIFWNSFIEKAEEGYNYLKIHQKICIVRTA